MNTRTMLAISVGAFFLGGCGGADPSPGGTPSGQAPGAATATPDSVSVSGFAHASDGTLLRGASVCVKGEVTASACTTTGTDGAFALRASSYDQIAINFAKDGFLPTLRPVATRASDIVLPEGENAMMPAVVPQTFMGAAADPTKGHIEFAVLMPSSGAAPSVVATLTGDNGNTSPTIYLDASGAPTSGATGGTSGGFANLPPGMYVLRFSSPSANCTASSGSYGYPLTTYQDTSGTAAVIVPVVAGTVTAPVGVACSR